MNPLWWVLITAIGAAATGVIVYFIMHSRMQVLLSRQREELAAARATLAAQKEAIEGSLKGAQETTRRQAMDEFLADIRVEERHYTREHKMLFLTRKLLVRQERIFFRNIPLSNWVENEMPIEEGADLEKLAQAMSVFAPEVLAKAPHDTRRPAASLLSAWRG
jgi:hypothetical protein